MKKNSFQITLAEKTIAIHTDGEYLKNMCRSYRNETAAADFSVETDEADIDFEMEKYLERNRKVRSEERNEIFESLAIYRKIAERMIDYSTLLMHGSAIAVDGECYLFCADSGTGKSTHTKLWRQYFKDRAVMINDDKPLIQIGDNVNVFGTPWSGKHHLDTNTCAPLRAVCFLSRGETNEIHRINKEDAMVQLMQYSYHSEQPERMRKTIGLLIDMLEKIPMYSLHCNMEPEAASVSWNGMQNQ